MNSTLLTTIHIVVVQLFLIIYLVKTILIFINQEALAKFTRVTRLLEMVVSVLFLASGTWLFIILGAIKMLQIVKLIVVFASIPIAIIGFKKKNKWLALFSFVLIVGAYGLAEAAKKKPFIPLQVMITGNASPESQLGIKTYVSNCSMCHGLDGKKAYREAKDLSLSTLNDTSVQMMIKYGNKGKMPGFIETLSTEEVTAVSAYVFTLRNQTP